MGNGKGKADSNGEAARQLTTQIWVYLEARQIAESVSQIDEWIKVRASVGLSVC